MQKSINQIKLFKDKFRICYLNCNYDFYFSAKKLFPEAGGPVINIFCAFKPLYVVNSFLINSPFSGNPN